jgi:hypothetical protein
MHGPTRIVRAGLTPYSLEAGAGGTKRGIEETGPTADAVEAQLAGAAALTLRDEDLDLVLPSEGFEALVAPP